MQSKSLVLGANGFIGKHLTEALGERGDDVVAFDRFYSREASFASKNIQTFRGDFLRDEDLKGALVGVKQVFHFLSLTTPMSSEDDPVSDLRTNILRTVELLEMCVEAGVDRFFFASTGGAIYGDQGLERYSEFEPTLPVSPYAIGKLAVEGYLRYFHKKHALKSVALRISNPYGPGQPRDRVQGLVPIMLRNIAADEPVLRLGDGLMRRDYIFIDDLISMIIQLSAGSPQHDTYNLGSGIGTSVNEVLQTARTITSVQFKIRERPQPASFLQGTVLDISRYQQEFGYFGQTELAEGMAATWKSILEEAQK